MSAAAIQFVAADEYHKRDKTLATRDDLNAAIAAVRAEVIEIRAEIRGIYRMLISGFAAVVVTLAAGFGAIIAKLFFGV